MTRLRLWAYTAYLVPPNGRAPAAFAPLYSALRSSCFDEAEFVREAARELLPLALQIFPDTLDGLVDDAAEYVARVVRVPNGGGGSDDGEEEQEGDGSAGAGRARTLASASGKCSALECEIGSGLLAEPHVLARVAGHGGRVLRLWRAISLLSASVTASVEAQDNIRRIWWALAALLRPFPPRCLREGRGGAGAGGAGGGGGAQAEGAGGRAMQEEEKEEEEEDTGGLVDVIAGFKKMEPRSVKDEGWRICLMSMCLTAGGDARAPRSLVPQAVDLCVEAAVEGMMSEETLLRQVSREVCVWLCCKGDEAARISLRVAWRAKLFRPASESGDHAEAADVDDDDDHENGGGDTRLGCSERAWQDCRGVGGGGGGGGGGVSQAAEFLVRLFAYDHHVSGGEDALRVSDEVCDAC